MTRNTAITILLAVLGLWLGWRYLNAGLDRPTPTTEADVPAFIGSPAHPRPIAPAYDREQHPFLAPIGRNSMHNDAAQSDSYTWAGPLGQSAEVSTQQFHRILGSCVAQSFASNGLMYGTCVTPFGVTLVARRPDTLEIVARQLITRWLPIGQKFSGGVYFHLDEQDRVLLASNDLSIQRWQLQAQGSNYRWQLEADFPVGDILDAAGPGPHRIIDTMPDWEGNYWVITRAGLVGVVDSEGNNGRAIELTDEGIDNAMAVGRNGLFVVSDHAMYSFKRAKDGSIEVQWREAYDRGSAPKEGTMGWGSGTTPTLIGSEYVAVTDNADGRINVMVYAQTPRSGSQQVCKHPIFPANRGTTENSLAAVGYSLIAENNYGYSGPRNVPQSAPGLTRVDIVPNGAGCTTAWENLTITSPSAVPKVSEANGLIYLYTRDKGNPADLHAWYFTAVDFHSGELVYKQLTGTGWLFNNHYGSISISPEGAAYVGMMGGVVKIVDGAP
ncbi:hypothetical protein EY643_14875 [Halioglobus maricola]|uniref:Uncharacterized protein n=1 Tax=Halioglobus maricola TaxID=2601894 RepID=A0A5P9NMH8_9GAMM|nr:hypothetical protein [Halioglobus maricola]QFU76829.1 hypothetical protein EY643_14875 [Halioglobus maricola]